MCRVLASRFSLNLNILIGTLISCYSSSDGYWSSDEYDDEEYSDVFSRPRYEMSFDSINIIAGAP